MLNFSARFLRSTFAYVLVFVTLAGVFFTKVVLLLYNAAFLHVTGEGDPNKAVELFPDTSALSVSMSHHSTVCSGHVMCKNKFCVPLYFYTVNHKKRDILFLTITSANRSRFL